MRQTVKNGVTIKYPDEICFAFNPCLVIASGGEFASMDVTVGGLSVQVHAHENTSYVDFRELVQSQFDGAKFTVSYKQTEDTGAGKPISVETVIYSEGGWTVTSLTFSIFAVWGAMYPGETYNVYRELTYFKGYPFAFGLQYSGGTGTVLVENDGVPTSFIEVTGSGVFNFIIPKDTAKEYYDIWDYNGTFSGTTFDDTFDFTFRSTLNGTTFDDTFDFTFRSTFNGTRKMIRIYIKECHLDTPGYLRWIDRHGFWCHWLFKKGDESRVMEATGEFMRNNLLSWDGSYGYQGAGGGRRQAYGREDSFEVCAPLVDKDTFDFLQDITTSPIVDIYMEDSKKWTAVTVKEGTYTKTTAALQDFTCMIVRNQHDIQSL